jgi:hypothetical protein
MGLIKTHCFAEMDGLSNKSVPVYQEMYATYGKAYLFCSYITTQTNPAVPSQPF